MKIVCKIDLNHILKFNIDYFYNRLITKLIL
jgi:hypothetical protein